MDRDFYEQEISKLLEVRQNDSLSASEYYQSKIIELVLEISDEEYLHKIYSFVFGFTEREVLVEAF